MVLLHSPPLNVTVAFLGPGGFPFLGPGGPGFGHGFGVPFAPWLGALAVTAVAAGAVAPYYSNRGGNGRLVWMEGGREVSSEVNLLTVRAEEDGGGEIGIWSSREKSTFKTQRSADVVCPCPTVPCLRQSGVDFLLPVWKKSIVCMESERLGSSLLEI